MYVKVAKRIDHKCSHYKKKKWKLCDRMEVLANVMAAIILKYVHVSNQHVVHLKFTQR